jgi:hypothetical protein
VSDIQEVERAADGSDDTARYSAWGGADAVSRQRPGYASGYESGSHTLFDILAEMLDAVKEAAPAESAADHLGLVEREFAQCGSIVRRHAIHVLHHRSP